MNLKGNHWFNFAAIFATAVILAAMKLVKTGLVEQMEIVHYAAAFGLTALVLFLPKLLVDTFQRLTKFAFSEGIVSIAVLFLLSLIGWCFGENAILPWLISFLGVGLAVYVILSNKVSWVQSILGILFLLFMTGLFHVNGKHTPLLAEKFLLGTVYIDRLFHPALSNMISILGQPALGIDGPVQFNYHYLSHALSVGFSNLINCNALDFYGTCWPAIFIPFFFKSMFLFMDKLAEFLDKPISGPLVTLAILFTLYASGIPDGSGLFSAAFPLSVESLTIALIVGFLLLFSIMERLKSFSNVQIWMVVIVTLVMMCITFLKISVGVLLTGTLFWALVRNQNNYKILISGGLSVLMVGAVAVLFVAPAGRGNYDVSLMGRLVNYWYAVDGLVLYFFGILLLLFYFIGNGFPKRLSDAVSIAKSGDKEYRLFESLAIMCFGGLMIGAILTETATDVFNLGVLSFFFGLPVAIIYLNQWIVNRKAGGRIFHGVLVLICLLNIGSRPDLLDGVRDIITTRAEVNGLRDSNRKNTLQEFLKELTTLDSDASNQNSIVYVPLNESWLYNSQQNKFYEPIVAPLIVPALSGLPLIGGISDSIYNSEFNYFTIYAHRSYGRKQVRGIDEAKNLAGEWGFSKLIFFYEKDGVLVRKDFPVI